MAAAHFTVAPLTPAPSPGRVFASLSRLPSAAGEERLVLFGGLAAVDGQERCVADLLEYSIRNGAWRSDVLLPSGSSNCPSPRCRHAAAVCAGALYVYGGAELIKGTEWKTCPEYLYRLEPTLDDKYRWIRVHGKGAQPGPRFGHCMQAVAEGEPALLVFAGHSGKELLNDLYMFRVNSATWFGVEMSNVSRPLPGAWYSMLPSPLQTDSFIIVGGGQSADDGADEIGAYSGYWLLSRTRAHQGIGNENVQYTWTREHVDCLPAFNVPSISVEQGLSREDWSAQMGYADLVHFAGKGKGGQFDGQRPRDRIFAVVGEIGSAVMIMGGSSVHGLVPWLHIWTFPITTQRQVEWARVAVRAAPQARVGACSCAVGGTLVVMGGRLQDGTIADAELFELRKEGEASNRRLLQQVLTPAPPLGTQPILASSATSLLLRVGDDNVSLQFLSSTETVVLLGNSCLALVDSRSERLTLLVPTSTGATEKRNIDVVAGPILGRNPVVARGLSADEYVVLSENGNSTGMELCLGKGARAETVWQGGRLRRGSSLTLLPLLNVHVCFGGEISNRPASSKEDNLWFLNVQKRPVEFGPPEFAVAGLSPESRHGHAACASKEGHCLIVAGGIGVESKMFMDDAFILDACTATWTRIDLGGLSLPPSPLGLHPKSSFKLIVWAKEGAWEVDL